MNTQVEQPGYVWILKAGVAVVLFISAGTAAIIALFPAMTSGSGGIFALRNLSSATAKELVQSEQTAQRRARARALIDGSCAECGVIISIREAAKHDNDIGAGGGVTRDLAGKIQEKSIMQFDIDVRMADGSNRVVSRASPGSWRPGQHVIIIAGTELPRK